MESLTDREADLLAHALGWPDTRGYKAVRGRVRWRNPYRNQFCAGGDDLLVWEDLARRGLARRPRTSIPTCGVVFVVTPAGIDAARARLRPRKP